MLKYATWLTFVIIAAGEPNTEQLIRTVEVWREADGKKELREL